MPVQARSDLGERNLRGQCNPLPVSVDGLRLADGSARKGAARRRLSRLQMLLTSGSYFTLLTNISELCGSTGVAGDLSGCGRSCEQGAMRNAHQAGWLSQRKSNSFPRVVTFNICL